MPWDVDCYMGIMIISKGKSLYCLNVIHCTEFKIMKIYMMESKSLFPELHRSNLFSPETAVAAGSCVAFQSCGGCLPACLYPRLESYRP